MSTEQKIEILTAVAEQTFVYDHADVERDDRGRVQRTHKGYRIKAEKLGKSYDREGEVVVGVWADKLTSAAKARRNRALGRIQLDKVVKDMRLHGYPDMNQAELLIWFNDQHGDSKGVIWNTYDLNGRPVEAVSVSGPPAVNPHDKSAGLDTMEDAIGDEEFVQKQPDGRWYCSACKVYVAKGIAGHRRSNDHKDNVARLKAEAA